METDFTPFMSLAGGALIGLAAVLMMAFNGRIAGISGIVSRLLPPSPDLSLLPQGAAFVLGLLLTAPFFRWATGAHAVQYVTDNLALLVVAGVFVGFGTVLGGGCTSGHGVCGISRFSTRSIFATVSFLVTGAATVFVLRHMAGG